jgi:hypothetical protein
VEGKILTALPPQPEVKPEENAPEPVPEATAPEDVTQPPVPGEESAPSQVPSEQVPVASDPTAVTAPEELADKIPETQQTDVSTPTEEAIKPVELQTNEEQIQEPDVTNLALEPSPAIIPSANPLPDTNPKLIEKSDAGDLPIIGTDGTKPWQYYSKPFERKSNQPMIAVILTGVGQNRKVTEKIMALPESFTLSLSPYARDVTSWASSARLTAHERLVDIPMEPSNYPAADPGPHGLVIDKGLRENEMRLQWVLSRFTGYLGIVTPQNEVFTANNEAFRVILQSISNRGLIVVMGREPAKAETKEMLDSSNTAYVIADMLIDEEFTATSIDTRLVALEQLAKKRGYAIGVAQSTHLTVEQLRIWSESLAEKGIVLVPVSAIVKLRFS